MGVTDSVVRIDAEADARNKFGRHCKLRDGSEAGHVLLGGAESRFVASHEDVGAAINEHERVDSKACAEVFVRSSCRYYAHVLEHIDDPLETLARQPLRQSSLG